MKHKCPKCGADTVGKTNWTTGSTTYDFSCGTKQLPLPRPGGLVRGEDCYEGEIAALKALLQEMGEQIHSAVINLPDHKESWPCHCRSCAVGAMLSIILSRPEVRAILEEKP